MAPRPHAARTNLACTVCAQCCKLAAGDLSLKPIQILLQAAGALELVWDHLRYACPKYFLARAWAVSEYGMLPKE